MLANLVEVHEGVLESLEKGGHATEGSPLELLALEERLGIFQKAHVVAGDGLDEVLGGRQLAKGDLEVVGIVEGVEEILVERMDVLESGETLEDGTELLREGFLGELDLSGVESCKCLSVIGHAMQDQGIPPRILLILKPARI